MTLTATRRRTVSATILFALLATLAFTPGVSGAAKVPSAESASDGQPFVTLEQAALSVPTDGAFEMTATVLVDRPTSYLEARLQIHTPAGKLLYQKTEVRSRLETGTAEIGFGRDLTDLDLEPGLYPVTLRVRTQSDSVRQFNVNDALRVYRPGTEKVPVVVVARIESAPSLDANGRFTVDPATNTRARDEAVALARFVLENPGQRISLAIPPVLLEEWLRAANGYEHASPDGVLAVDKEDAVPRAYASALEVLKSAVGTTRLELLTVPYALPDLGAIDVRHRAADLDAHLLRTQSACLATLETSPSPVLYTAGGLLPAETLDLLGEREMLACVVATESVTTTGTVASGAYRVLEAPVALAALVLDPPSSDALRSGEASALVAAVFERSLSATPSAPIIAQVDLGPGRAARVDDLEACLSELEAAPWTRYATASQAASAPATETVMLAGGVPPMPDAPAGFWAEADAARVASAAFLEAVGVNDPDAQATNDLSLVAQSTLWAGPDLNWGSADRGRAIAAEALRRANEVLGAVTVVGSDITLSGTSGEVPVSISNGSQKNLQLRVEVTGEGVDVGPMPADILDVRPQDNLASVPVDLGQSLQGTVNVRVYAGEVLLDTVDVKVRASVLDRLVLIGGAALVLVGMLLFIRHRIRSVDRADTM